MERLTEHYGDRYIRIKGCTSAYLNKERKSAPASNAVVRLAAYEDTELSPEEIMGLCEMDRRAKMADLLRLEEYQALGPVEELSALVKARDEAVESWRGFCSKCAWRGKRHLSDGQLDARCKTCLENGKCNWEWRVSGSSSLRRRRDEHGSDYSRH